jgi:hypothetical protein
MPFRLGSLSKQFSGCSRQLSIRGVSIFSVPYDFADNEYELDPLAFSAREGGPPRKSTDSTLWIPPPPKRPPGSASTVPSSLFIRILAGLILTGIAIALFLLLFARH